MADDFRVGRSVLIGWTFQILLVALLFILAANDLEVPRAIRIVLFWNVALVFWLMGSPGIMFYDQNGNSMYEGTPVDGLYFIVGVSLGFVMYPAIFYGILSWFRNRRLTNN